MTALVLTFISTYFIELLHRRIVLARQCEKEIKKFNTNMGLIMNLDINNYKLGLGHLYES